MSSYPLHNSFIPLNISRLSHNVHGPHDQAFHALWNELREEYDDLVSKGYTGEGFIGQGSRLGGRNVPVREMRRQARASAERRKVLSAGSGRKLGGAPVLRGTDMRQVIADAAARRLTITQGCASNTKQGDEIAAEGAKSGDFRTKAQEADANERAIAQALWELVQEEEALKAGLPADAWKTENVTFNPNAGVDFSPEPQARIPPKPRDVQPARPQSTPSVDDPPLSKPPISSSWACPVCTLVNRGTYLICDACGIERVSSAISPSTSRSSSANTISRSRPLPATVPAKPIPLAHNRDLQPPQPALKRKLSHSDLIPQKNMGWNCRRCGTWMEHKWWTCSACGLMKDSSM